MESNETPEEPQEPSETEGGAEPEEYSQQPPKPAPPAPEDQPEPSEREDQEGETPAEPTTPPEEEEEVQSEGQPEKEPAVEEEPAKEEPQEPAEDEGSAEKQSTEDVDAEPEPTGEEAAAPEDAPPPEEVKPKESKQEEEEEPKFEKGIFAIKTSIGHEKMVADTLQGRVKRRNADVYSIMLPPNLRGYLLIEALDNREALRELIKGVQHARTIVEGTTTIEEIEGFLAPKPIVSGIEEGDIVEVIAGPFKGEKAKVKQIDLPKEEITIELFEAMVSIPVTIRGDHVRVLEKESS